MRRLRYLGISGDCPYRSARVDSWAVGEMREVADDLAEYLLGTFPGVFVSDAPAPSLDQSPVRAVVEASPVKRARKRSS